MKLDNEPSGSSLVSKANFKPCLTSRAKTKIHSDSINFDSKSKKKQIRSDHRTSWQSSAFYRFTRMPLGRIPFRPTATATASQRVHRTRARGRGRSHAVHATRRRSSVPCERSKKTMCASSPCPCPTQQEE